MIIHGDSHQELKNIADNSIDFICTDPPYGYSFMGKHWDKAVPSVEIWKECLRILKPGAFINVMSAPRSDVLSRMIVNIEDAGFRVDFTPIYWTYASGFPKAGNIGKLVDKRLGVDHKREFSHKNPADRPYTHAAGETSTGWQSPPRPDKTHPYSPQAKALEGSYSGFQPKPAVEVIIVAMKPLSEKTFVDQALSNGKGISWLDDGRIPTDTPIEMGRNGRVETATFQASEPNDNPQEYQSQGRFPANLLVENEILGDHSKFFALPFLIVPKASKSEKNKGLEQFNKITVGDGRPIPIDNAFQRGKTWRVNSHPTVKPLKLMSYLITLFSREGNIVLDPFCGSGTTCLAAKLLQRDYIGIEQEQEYIEIVQARLDAVRPTLF